MTVQFLKIPGGEDLAVLPRSEYEMLVTAAEDAAEDAADVAAYDAAMADPAGLDTLPAELSRLILSGGGLVRALRLWRGLEQAELARRLGRTVDFVADLEERRPHRDAELSRDLAQALDVPERWLAP